MIKGLEHFCGDRLRELGPFSVEKAPAGPYSTFQYLKGTYKRAGEDFLQGQVVTGQGGVALNGKRAGLD